MNSKERQIERDKKIDQILDKVDIILELLGLDLEDKEGDE